MLAKNIELLENKCLEYRREIEFLLVCFGAEIINTSTNYLGLKCSVRFAYVCVVSDSHKSIEITILKPFKRARETHFFLAILKEK